MDRCVISERAVDARTKPRTNMYLAAVLCGEGFSSPVKIRNMSAEGALVESAVVPGRGSAIRLVRGSLVAHGHVAWSADARCGLQFSSLVSVRHWLAPAANQEQQRIDDIVRVVKAGAVPLPSAHQVAGAASVQSEAAATARLPDDLRHVATLLDVLAEDLANDDAVVARHALKLQNLDIAMQTIAAVVELLSGDTGNPAALARLRDLRAISSQTA